MTIHRKAIHILSTKKNNEAKQRKTQVEKIKVLELTKFL